MKKQLLIISSIFVSGGVFAQPTFNHTDVAPQAGDILTMLISGVHPSPGSAGVNQTWNLSTMSQTATIVNSVTAIGSSPYAANFPNATLQDYNGTNYGFYNTASSQYMNAGFVGNGQTQSYSNQEELMQFPMTYNKQFTDTWGGAYTANSIPMNRTATSTVHYDGYGTVTTPAGVFTNVARLRTVQVISDVSQFVTITTTITNHAWWKLGERFPIALVSNIITPFSNTDYSWYRTVSTSNTVGINDYDASAASVLVYPNPAADVLYINAIDDHAVSVEFLDLQGMLIYSEHASEGTSLVNLNVSALAEGMYAMRVKTIGGKTETKKIVIRH